MTEHKTNRSHNIVTVAQSNMDDSVNLIAADITNISHHDSIKSNPPIVHGSVNNQVSNMSPITTGVGNLDILASQCFPPSATADYPQMRVPGPSANYVGAIPNMPLHQVSTSVAWSLANMAPCQLPRPAKPQAYSFVHVSTEPLTRLHAPPPAYSIAVNNQPYQLPGCHVGVTVSHRAITSVEASPIPGLLTDAARHVEPDTNHVPAVNDDALPLPNVSLECGAQLNSQITGAPNSDLTHVFNATQQINENPAQLPENVAIINEQDHNKYSHHLDTVRLVNITETPTETISSDKAICCKQIKANTTSPSVIVILPKDNKNSNVTTGVQNNTTVDVAVKESTHRCTNIDSRAASVENTSTDYVASNYLIISGAEEKINSSENKNESNGNNDSSKQEGINALVPVTLEQARQGLMKTITYLEAHPEIAGDHIHILWVILRLVNEYECKVEEKHSLPDFWANRNQEHRLRSNHFLEQNAEVAFNPDHNKHQVFSQTMPNDGILSVGSTIRHRKGRGRNVRKKIRNKTIQCLICSKWFYSPSDLVSHSRIHSGERPFKCEQCGKGFTQSGNLQAHMRIHTGERPYNCLVCPRAFAHSDLLQVHMRSHTGEKPYQCLICGKCFARSNSLKAHNRIHTGDKPYTCQSCGASFIQNNVLKAHMRTHTGEKPFKCTQCDKDFRVLGNFKKHMLVHAAVKSHMCEQCGRTFTHPEYLQAHIKNHADDKPFKCNECGKSFTIQRNLQRHLKVHDSRHPGS